MKTPAFFLAVLAAFPALAGALIPDGVARDIAAHGARAVVARLSASGDYDRVMDRVDKGDARWIALVPKLAPGADAGLAEELPIALAFALPNNPGAVLSVLEGKDGFAVEDVCSAPFIEGTVKSIPAYVKRAKAALARVADPNLAKVKAACVAQLEKVIVPWR